MKISKKYYIIVTNIYVIFLYNIFFNCKLNKIIFSVPGGTKIFFFTRYVTIEKKHAKKCFFSHEIDVKRARWVLQGGDIFFTSVGELVKHGFEYIR